jgi:hypothetical protein
MMPRILTSVPAAESIVRLALVAETSTSRTVA